MEAVHVRMTLPALETGMGPFESEPGSPEMVEPGFECVRGVAERAIGPAPSLMDVVFRVTCDAVRHPGAPGFHLDVTGGAGLVLVSPCEREELMIESDGSPSRRIMTGPAVQTEHPMVGVVLRVTD